MGAEEIEASAFLFRFPGEHGVSFQNIRLKIEDNIFADLFDIVRRPDLQKMVLIDLRVLQSAGGPSGGRVFLAPAGNYFRDS